MHTLYRDRGEADLVLNTPRRPHLQNLGIGEKGAPVTPLIGHSPLDLACPLF